MCPVFDDGTNPDNAQVECLPETNHLSLQSTQSQNVCEGELQDDEVKASIFNKDPVSILRVPRWVDTLVKDGIKGFQFYSDFSLYWCDCGQTNTRGSTNGHSRSNLMKHRARNVCTFDPSQLKIGDRPIRRAVPSRLAQSNFRTLLTKSVVQCNLPFSVVDHEAFKKLLTYGQGRYHLKIPSRYTVSRSVRSQFDEVTKCLHRDIAYSCSGIAIAFDLWNDRCARGYLGVTRHVLVKMTHMFLSLRSCGTVTRTEI